ncbi:DUF5777 family beta-barrel protein [Sediminibacterium soli]|uniref:DUF5777 family beta-barrel protein n=1 Tax=Sediminibacterium soli TaxID=2698829 RepID=UPI00137A75ED|nr:DUF5777 family beta-barrel protein [Sediminibacterium soli]NCI47738.1 hypothetical protein [Sediminibacterium soli]
MQHAFKSVLAIVCLVLSSHIAFSQEVDLFKMQDSANAAQSATRKEPVINTFYSTRLVNSHTVEITGKGSMDFRINHRFAPVNTGLYNMFGLDAASMRMGFDFGIANNLMVGIGRSTFFKELDGFVKYRVVHQQEGAAPVSVALLASLAYRTLDMDPTLKVTGSDRTFFTGQVLIGSKLNSHTSLQISPTYTHYNRVLFYSGGSQDLFSIGFLGRQRISKRISLTAEYFLQTNRFNGTYDPLSVGVDINTGGHVFQLHFTNSTGMNEHTFIHETTGSWGNGDIRWGFNISRIFHIGRKKKGDWAKS